MRAPLGSATWLMRWSAGRAEVSVWFGTPRRGYGVLSRSELYRRYGKARIEAYGRNARPREKQEAAEVRQAAKAFQLGCFLLPLCVLFGVGFACSAYSKRRAAKGEATALQNMLNEGTTLAELQAMAVAGKALPPVVVLRGELGASSDIGRGMSIRKLFGAPDGPGQGIAIRQLLVTRLGVDARKIRRRNRLTSSRHDIARAPKKMRSNVAIGRLEADGLHFIGQQGGSAAMILPGLEEELSNAVPSLFLAAQEENLIDRIHHVSEFVVCDDEPSGDVPRSFLRAQEKKLDRMRRKGTEQPNLWRFDPETFYDGGISKFDGKWRYFRALLHEHGGLPSFGQVEYTMSKEFVKRAETAAD
eukprot:COSAG02_NODE_13601_length_1374_cov_0.763922_1_plen_358_part_01